MSSEITTSPSSSGRAREEPPAVERKREHVGRPILARCSQVQLSESASSVKRTLSSAVRARALQHAVGQDARASERARGEPIAARAAAPRSARDHRRVVERLSSLGIDFASSRNFFEPDVGERVLGELRDHLERQRGDVRTEQRRLHDVHRVSHARDQHLGLEV